MLRTFGQQRRGMEARASLAAFFLQAVPRFSGQIFVAQDCGATRDDGSPGSETAVFLLALLTLAVSDLQNVISGLSQTEIKDDDKTC